MLIYVFLWEKNENIFMVLLFYIFKEKKKNRVFKVLLLGMGFFCLVDLVVGFIEEIIFVVFLLV